MDAPGALPLKIFSQTFKNIPELEVYEGTLPESYWRTWTKKTYEELQSTKSWISPNKLMTVARAVGYTGREGRIKRAMDRLQYGADIGCRGDGRLPTERQNSRSATEFGVRVADSLQGWIEDGLCFGPMGREEMPWEAFTVNPITVKLKPNGKARICINMSAPYKTEGQAAGTPSSVNSGINKDEFPTSMASTTSFCKSLMRAGCPAEMCKLDWNQAYKHIAVRKEDHNLQVFQFGGKFFGELMLTFGGGSSAGIYDDMAKLVKEIAIRKSKTDDRMINQVLDDVVGCGAEGDGSVNRFYDSYREVAEFIGVSLADESDQDKAFRASSTGKVFGISYDLRRWVWSLSNDKLIPILITLDKIKKGGRVDNGSIMSLNGKLNHYMWLVPNGPWQRGFLLNMQDSTKPSGHFVEINPLAQEQASWWSQNIRAACEESDILDPRPMGSMLPIEVFTDAAGGDAGKIRNGMGGFIPPHHWFYMPWPQLIRDNRENSLGTRFANKLCTLEGLAALTALATIPDLARNREVVVYCDNAGFVAVFKKKHSRCAYAYTVAKALHDVGEGLASVVKVVKTRRCSGVGEEAADALSKGDWDRAWDNMPLKNENPGRIPRALLVWANNPTPDMDLGAKILSDMSKYTQVLFQK